jgi:eukaryotic-like serine/threonine-protein kinase
VVHEDSHSPGPYGGGARSVTAIRGVILVCAVAYVAYLGLLIAADLRPVAPLGFEPRFESGQLRVANLQPSSIGARAGLLNGDRVREANDQVLAGRVDWQRVRGQLDPWQPLELTIERDGRVSAVTLALRPGVAEPGTSPRPALLGFRLAQGITLALALLVAFKRPLQPSALIGALVLASIATTSLVLPMRLIAFWQAIPTVPGTLLWVPFTTSVASGALLFAFAWMFPQPVWRASRLMVALLPAAAVAGWHLYVGSELTRALGPATGWPDATTAMSAVNAGYGALGVGLLLRQWRMAGTPTDRRRIGVLILGALIGACAGMGVIAGYWRNPGGDIFASRTLTALSLVFLAVPASFAYAILRHRLFDIRLIVRQGIRYALARRVIDALIPALAALVVVDVFVHRDQSVGVMVESRWWWFTLVGIALLLVRSRRDQWLQAVDRRFFRERYDAQRLLTSIADQVNRAVELEAIAPAILQQIDEALRPAFVCLFEHTPAESTFVAFPHGSVEKAAVPLPTSLTVIGVLTVLRKPLALTLGDTAWVRQQLPASERSLLIGQGIELLVPISSPTAGDVPLGLLALGPRRSEEPYGQEDLELLATIADAIGVLLQRSSANARAIGECGHCGRCFAGGVLRCPHDDHPLAVVAGSLLLNGRYRLERCLGRGGMGVVYAAVDVVLERRVAVKVIRDEVACDPLHLAARFRGEARAAAAFAHPHVVRVYDFGIDEGTRPFLVMELLEGTTLRERLVPGLPLTVAETLDVLRGVCAALDAAHDRGLVHRDLKPENIFLQNHSAGAVPKILDFGLAKAFDLELRPERTTAFGTSAGLMVGTLEYMAPEQLTGDVVNPGWDVWATSVIAYEMLTGSHPFRHDATFGSPSSDFTGSREPGVVLSDSARAFFRRALSTERALRPSRAAGFLAACEQALM